MSTGRDRFRAVLVGRLRVGRTAIRSGEVAHRNRYRSPRRVRPSLSSRSLSGFLNLRDFFRRSLPMLPRLIDERGGEELRRIELRDGEPVKPRFAATREAAQSGAVHVPICDVDAVRTALTEEKGRHNRECKCRAKEKQTKRRVGDSVASATPPFPRQIDRSDSRAVGARWASENRRTGARGFGDELAEERSLS